VPSKILKEARRPWRIDDGGNVLEQEEEILADSRGDST